MEPSTQDSKYSGKQVQILNVAERLFAAQGFDGTSVRDIAQQAGVNVAMISYYFGSKDKLLLAVFNYRISAGRLVLEHLVNDKDLHPLDKIDALVEAMVERMVQNNAFHRVMLRAQLTAEHEDVAKMMAEMKLKNLSLVNEILEEGQQKNVFTPGVDAGLLMATLSGTIYQVATAASIYNAGRLTDAPSLANDEALKTKLKTHLKRVLKATVTYDQD